MKYHFILWKPAQWTTLSRSIYVIDTSVATTLVQKSAERGENHNKSGYIDSCSYGKGLTVRGFGECQMRCHVCSPSNYIFSQDVICWLSFKIMSIISAIGGDFTIL